MSTMQAAQSEQIPPEIAHLKQRLAQLSALDDDGRYREGPAKRAARSQAVSDAVKALWDQALRSDSDFGSGSSPVRGIGLAAVGSLARGEFGPHSDLDLVLIYDDHLIDADVVKRLADKLWYPLWDAGIALDYSVRTVRQSESITDTDLPAAIGWLTVLSLAGDADLIETTSVVIAERWRKAARKRLGEIEASIDKRVHESGTLAYLGQPNIKEARGGLRDVSLVMALADSWLADRPHGTFDSAARRLLEVRDCLHLAAGKETNMLLAEYQPQVAAMLGLADPTLPHGEREHEASVDLLALVARLSRIVAYSLDSTLSRAKHSLIHEKPAFPLLPKRWSNRFSAKHPAPQLESVAEGISIHEGQIVLDTRADVVRDRALPLRVGLVAAERGMRIAPITVSSLAAFPVDDSSWNDDLREVFVRMLMTGSALIPVWEELDMARIPSRLIPEWDAIRNRPSAAAVHRFTVDRHMVEVVSRLDRLSPTGDAYDAAHVQELFLAGIFHDIGKRRGVTHHCLEGARQASTILRRMGYPPRTIAHVAHLIREHLTLSDFATQRDPDNPATWRDLSDVLGGDPILLDMLFDLTRADASSLGATSNELLTKKYGWSSWRARLVTQMYQATRSWMVR